MLSICKAWFFYKQECDGFLSPRWCRDCVQLHLEMFKSGKMRPGCRWEHEDLSNAVIDLSRNKLYENMKWMISLKGFSVRSKLSDRCLDNFCHWLLFELNAHSLEKLWLPSVKAVCLSTVKPQPVLSSLYLGRLDSHLCSTLFPQATHLSGVSISLNSKLPHLRFLRGNFVSSSVSFIVALKMLPDVLVKICYFYFQFNSGFT